MLPNPGVDHSRRETTGPDGAPAAEKRDIYYPIQALVDVSITEVLMVTGANSAGDFMQLIGNRAEFGLNSVNYAYQEKEGGIAEALLLAEHFTDGGLVCVVLRDNLFEKGYHASYGLDAISTQGSNTYGPRQYPEKIIPLFIVNTLQGKPLPVYGDGSAVRDYLHVEDHCAGIDAVLRKGTSGGAYNVGLGEQIHGVRAAKTILTALEQPESLILHAPDRPGHDYRYSVDPTAA
jgi:nucleoside-diphosphate-sugar epimerase